MRAVLFDLDGTLLPIDTEEFIKKYLELLSIKMADRIPPKIFIDKLLFATEKMVKNLEDKHNQEVFMDHFFEDILDNKEDIINRFNDFYQNDFKVLKSCAKNNPDAQDILEHLHNKNITLVLATNPIFPLTAITERLSWIDVQDTYFDLITSYEVMKYCKPHKNYYQQIVDLLKLNPNQCLMIGNDAQEDLVASEIGMETFLVEDYLIRNDYSLYEPTYRGSFKDLKKFILNSV
ncbi:MAG: HAD family hydrolase [Bacillota bacterium]